MRYLRLFVQVIDGSSVASWGDEKGRLVCCCFANVDEDSDVFGWYRRGDQVDG